MTTLKIISATALVLTSLAAGSSGALAATPADCRGGEERIGIGTGPLAVSSVHVLKTKRQVGKHIFDVKSGVSLVIPAEQGISMGYVERAVACELARGSSAKGVFAVAGVTAKVTPIVGGYMVNVQAPSGKTEEVIQVAMDQHLARAEAPVRVSSK